jgi:hypothetical protein
VVLPLVNITFRKNKLTLLDKTMKKELMISLGLIEGGSHAGQGSMSHASDDDDETDDKERKEETSQWRSILKVLGDNQSTQSRITHADSRRRPYIRRLQSLT